MADFLLELACEEIPARMQAKAAEQLALRFGDGLGGRVPFDRLETFVTPRRLVLYAHGLGAAGNVVSEERRGPRCDAPAQALDGFLRVTGLTRDQLEERDTPKGKFFYATITTEGRPTTDLLAELIPAIVRDFDWPKSMRWGPESAVTTSPRWVRPLTGIVALFDDAVVPFEVAGLASGRSTRGHRFMSHGAIEIAHPRTYAAQLRDAHVIIDAAERRAIIADRAAALASAAGLTLIPDDGLLHENAGLTEWPVPLLGSFDPAFLNVPPEVIQLTMRTNQKYFACTAADGKLAPAFVAVANIAANDGGAAIAAGNARVLSARLSDAKFFWDADVAKVTKDGFGPFTDKLADIVFHAQLGSVKDKVERVAKLARWLVESGAVLPSPLEGEGERRALARPGERGEPQTPTAGDTPLSPLAVGESPSPSRGEGTEALAAMAEQAARLCKADLVSATVGEFPEVQGLAGGYLARAAGLPDAVADAISDHYKPVGQGDDVPTAPVTVAVALADKLDTLVAFFAIKMAPTGSKDPFALRRAALGLLDIVIANGLRCSIRKVLDFGYRQVSQQIYDRIQRLVGFAPVNSSGQKPVIGFSGDSTKLLVNYGNEIFEYDLGENGIQLESLWFSAVAGESFADHLALTFLADRLKVQQREAGVRHDLIDAVFALGGEDDLVRLLARVHALQAFLQTPDGGNLLAGTKRAANILRIEEAKDGAKNGAVDPALLAEPAEAALNAALDAALPAVTAALAAEDFAGAMAALSQLRPAVDAFFEGVIVNAPDPALRINRLHLLNRLRQAVDAVADFSKVEG